MAALPIAPRPTTIASNRSTPRKLLAREIRDRARLAGQRKDVEAGVRAIDRVDVAAIIDLDVVRLDRDLAAIGAVDFYAARIGLVRRRRNEVRDLARMIGIADVERANARVEMREEQDAPIIDRR